MRVYPGSHSLHPPHPAAALAADWDTLWLFLLPRNDGLVWRLNASLQTVGWELTTATWGGYGRKVGGGEDGSSRLRHGAATDARWGKGAVISMAPAAA